MRFNFKELNPGAIISLIAIGLAIISLFLPWMDFRGRNQNAFLEGEFIIILPLLYPLVILLLGKTLRVFPGILAVVVSLLAGSVLLNIYIMIMDRNSDPAFGIFVFLVAVLGALYGLVRWSLPGSVPSHPEGQAEDQA